MQLYMAWLLLPAVRHVFLYTRNSLSTSMQHECRMQCKASLFQAMAQLPRARPLQP